jgi:NitT/TauT family transport system substrate-binding protein
LPFTSIETPRRLNGWMTGFNRFFLAPLLALAFLTSARAEDTKVRVGVLRLSSSAPVFIA